jgi:serine/threonine-protein kinase
VTDRTCRTCGTAVPQGGRFCLACGAQVTDPGAITVAVPDGPAAQLARVRAALAADYDVERELGRGGMAVVYRATERALGRAVAIKVLPPDLALTPAVAERFRREARLAAALEHPHVIPIHRVGTADGLEYIAMKLVEGTSVDELVRRHGPLPLPAALAVLRAAVGALAAAHAKGVVHRDIKGANILVERDGRVLLADFGIARATDGGGMTATGTVMGTPYFMSPEQCEGKNVGPASDQYSLGVVAFQLFAGQVPFDADTLPGILHHHFFTPVPDVAAIRDDAPPGLAEWIARAMAKRPEDRFPDAAAMREALDALPVPAAVRREGESQLAALVGGGTVPRVTARPFTTTSIAESRPSRAAAVAASVPPTRAPEQAAPRDRGNRGDRPYAPQLADTLHATPRSLPGSPAARRGRGALVAGALLLGLVAAGGGWWWTQRRSDETRLADEAIAMSRAGRAEAAMALAEKAANAAPRRPGPHIVIARLARETRDYERAGRELRIALQLRPDHPLALREMGALQLAMGRPELAARFYERALARAPEDRVARGYLACALRALGRDAEADAAAQRAGPGEWITCAVPR